MDGWRGRGNVTIVTVVTHPKKLENPCGSKAFSYLFIIVGSCLFNFLISYFINRIEKKKSIDTVVTNLESNNLFMIEIGVL